MFWEYNNRSDQGLGQHLEYLHYNHVKHGCIERLAAWTLSIFHRCVKPGFYEREWDWNLAHEKLDLECGK